jgi:hypothetical protein
MFRVTAGHHIESPLKGSGAAVGYYPQDGLEPPGVWEGKAAEAEAAVAALDEFATPAKQRRTRAKVPGSAGAAVPFYGLTFCATKSLSLL